MIGVILILASSFFIIVALKTRLPFWTRGMPGANFFPLILLVILLGLSLLHIIVNFKKVNTNEKVYKKTVFLIITILIFSVFYIISIRNRLFLFSTPLFIFISQIVLYKIGLEKEISKNIFLSSIIRSIFFSAILYYLFIVFLNLPIPMVRW